MTPKIRLYVEHPLGAGQPLTLSREHAHYLFGVMRQSVGAEIALFNGRDGVWRARVREAGRKSGTLEATEQLSPQTVPPDVWLCFAPIKKARTDFIVEKAAEMGVRRILPVQTAYTNAERIRLDRLQAHVIEAAEQCGGCYVPEIAPLTRLDRLLADWPDNRHVMFCDESAAGAGQALPRIDAPWAVLIGPEGGFSQEERAQLKAMPRAHAVSLGPRILRADTAAVAALTLWQDQLGDWA